jgi:hypothetical protein
VTSVLAGVLYTVGGRELAYSVCAIVMVALAVGAYWLVGPDGRRMRATSAVEIDPAATHVPV